MAGALASDGGGAPTGFGGAGESGGASGANSGGGNGSSGGVNQGGTPDAGGAAGSSGGGGPPGQVFTHPGLPLTLEDLNALKANLTIEPWKSAYAALTSDSHSQLSYAMQGPFADVSRTPDVNLGQYRNDMQAVFNLARMWFFTGNSAYGKKGRDIMIAWAKTHTSWSGAEPYLTMGDYAYRMYGGADILRGTWPGWTQADTDACKAYFSNVYWSAAVVPHPLRSANQGVEQLITGVGVATFNDDSQKFMQTLQAFRADAVNLLAPLAIGY
jgi:Alginate lyase